MAYISLDNRVEYDPQPKKSSKGRPISDGVSSFQTTSPLLGHPASGDICATVVPPASASKDLSSFANINSATTEPRIDIEKSCPPPAAALVASNAFDEKDKNKDHSTYDQKVNQETCQSPTEKIHDNHYAEHYTEENTRLCEPSETTETSLAEDLTVTRSLEIGMSPLLSDGEIERHRSPVAEKFLGEMPSTVPDDPIAWAAQSDATCIDQRSPSPAITSTGDAMCLDTLADKGRQQSVCQHSLIAEATVAQSEPSQTRQVNRSQQGRNTLVGMPCKSLPVVVHRRPLQSSKVSRTTRQSCRSRFIPSTDSDDPGDSDYHEHSQAESQIEDDEPVARPAKRKRTANTGMNASQLRKKRVQAHSYQRSSSLRVASPESAIHSSTSPETIRIQGQFLRKVSLSRVEYCCCVAEDENSAVSNPISSDIWASFKKLADKGGQSTGMPDFQAIDIEGLFTRELKPCGYIWSFNFKEKHAKSPENHSLPQEGRVSPTLDDLVVDSQTSPRADECVPPKGKDYTAEEDELIVHLKETEKLSWSRIAARFPKRTQMALQFLGDLSILVYIPPSLILEGCRTRPRTSESRSFQKSKCLHRLTLSLVNSKAKAMYINVTLEAEKATRAAKPGTR
ncbi:hypothetical protein UA08_09510 [Talaromyces atroroseus]|uniref:Myb-like domain-containing protein n=1 Tax=Talaromyces atroroseus TaxID=1441469 RepID=A0A1Q5Q602_TALAT|nr:hypothetical protein UA08_09510 [Talaromyces atroroseus]OKL55221.1 hypothetical protein UA08_09510 [Talaromyces atroroseus]